MKRKHFITNLMAIGGVNFLPQSYFKHYQKFYLLQCFVAGFKYYEGMEMVNEMQEGDLLTLVREPENEFDKRAIALHWNGRKIGFIPAAFNKMLRRLLDADALKLVAEIVQINKEVAPWENLNIAVYFLKEMKEEIPPQSVYLTQLKTPYYRSYKAYENTVSQMEIEDDSEFENEEDWYAFFESHYKNDVIYDIIHTSNIDLNEDFGNGEREYLVINKKSLISDNPLVRKVIAEAEEICGELQGLFEHEGYLILSTEEVKPIVREIKALKQVVDTLNQKYIELVL